MPHSNNLCYEFGPYVLNMVQRVLTRSGETISLTPKATDLLALLVENAGQLLEKEELLKAIWPDTFVEEGNVSQAIFQLRRALGDNRSTPKYIETVTRRGYRFISPVRLFAIANKSWPLIPRVIRNDGVRTEEMALAVLPFVNETGDAQVQHLATAISDTLTNNLSKLPKLRVIAAAALMKYRSQEIDLAELGRLLNVDTVITGRIIKVPSDFRIMVEVIDAANGWQLWGESYHYPIQAMAETQDAIVRELLLSLETKLTGHVVRRTSTRHTEKEDAYKAYLRARSEWNHFTETGFNNALTHFREAIEKDPYYALAYAGAVDCYLRLATSYFPSSCSAFQNEINTDREERLRLRHEWDWRNADREIRRATELNKGYPAAHQWNAAYEYSRDLFLSLSDVQKIGSLRSIEIGTKLRLPPNTPFLDLTKSEQIQVFCTVAREQIDGGNYSGAYAVLKPYWQLGTWPNLDGIEATSCADLLFTCGEIAGFLASTLQLPEGQKDGEALLSGAVALFEQTGSKVRLAECRIELGLCYYRQGSFELGRRVLLDVLNELSNENPELRSLALIRLASLERHAGRLLDALNYLRVARQITKASGPWTKGRFHLEFGSTYKGLAISHRAIANERKAKRYFDLSRKHYGQSLYQFQAVGNHRLAATARANLGYLSLELDDLTDAEVQLDEAHVNFRLFEDQIKCAQVQDTLAKLYLKTGRLTEAKHIISKAVETMEGGDEDILLAEALITKGQVLCRLGLFGEGKEVIEAAHALARRIRDEERATLALVTLIEELGNQLDSGDMKRIADRIRTSTFTSQRSSTSFRVRKCLELLSLIETTRVEPQKPNPPASNY